MRAGQTGKTSLVDGKPSNSFTRQRWPAVRPTRVTLRSKGSDGLANRREDWKRGVPPSVGGGNDMVEHWAQFGVVREVKSGGNSEFLEDEHVVRA